MDTGIQLATRTAPSAPLPPSWLGRADAPPSAPDWSSIAQLSALQQQNLLAQIAYVSSSWDYKKIGVNNELGRYQVSTETLETYGLLTAGSNVSYGTDCVNYQHCWRAPVNTYAEYLTEVNNVTEFLNNSSAQELLSYQRLVDLYSSCIRIGAVRTTDTADMIAGMLYVAWQLGVGTPPSADNSAGTGAYAWRYFGVGAGSSFYVAGRYAVVILSK
jgi:hypothetical protein